MRMWSLIATLAIIPATALAGDPTSDVSSRDTSISSKSQIALPANAKLVGTTEVDEIRAFPEMRGTRGGRGPQGEAVVGVSAVDKVYQVNKPYRDVVRFFDNQFTKPELQQTERSSTQTAVAWKVKMPEGPAAHIIVRNTNPATIELVQASEAAGEIREGAPPPSGTEKPREKEMMNQNPQPPGRENLPPSRENLPPSESTPMQMPPR